MSGVDVTVWRLPFTVNFTVLAIPSPLDDGCRKSVAGGRERRAGGAPGEYASSPLETSPPYGNYFTIRTPFIPAAAWLGSVQR